jgi:hypothetical protein
MRANDRPSDPQSKSDAPGVATARTFQAHERLKDILELILG